MRRWLAAAVLMAILLAAMPSARAAAGGRPSPSPVLNLQVTDLADVGFVVTFCTSSEQAGAVRYGTSQTHLTSLALDDRDVARRAARPTVRSTVHRVTLTGLRYNTTYYYEPVVDDVAIAAGPAGLLKQRTAPLLPIRPPVTVYGTVVFGSRAAPAPGSVLLEGYWSNLAGQRSWVVSALSGAPASNGVGAQYEFLPELLDASGGAPFSPGAGATFHVMGEADVHARLQSCGPVSSKLGLHLTVMPALHLS